MERRDGGGFINRCELISGQYSIINRIYREEITAFMQNLEYTWLNLFVSIISYMLVILGNVAPVIEPGKFVLMLKKFNQ